MWRLGKTLQLNVLHVYRRPLDVESSIPEALARRYEFRELGGEEVMSFALDPVLNMSRRFVGEALLRGDRCFGVLAGGDLVAYHWQSLFGYAPCNHGVGVTFDWSKQTYQYKMFTVPEHRGRRLQRHSQAQADRTMRASGYAYTILYADSHNVASLRALSRVPMQRRVGTAVSMRLFGRHWTLHSPALARHGFRLVPDSQ
jgi:hypothetical protein